MLYKKVFLALLLSTVTCTSFAVAVLDKMDRQSINERTQPFAKVEVEGGVAGPKLQAAKLTPKVIYKKHCSTCHTSGVAGAPIFGNKKAWSSRLAQGIATLHKHAIHGIRAMPAMGTCTECSEDDIAKTVDYMVAKVK